MILIDDLADTCFTLLNAVSATRHFNQGLDWQDLLLFIPETTEIVVSREFSRIFFSFSLLVLDLEPFQFHFHFSKKSEGILFFTFHFSKKVKAIHISLFFLEKKE